ncbi:MAG: hypothetical protein QM503_01465 [Bacteroidota bacterium]
MTKKTISYAFLILLLSTLTVTNWSCEKLFGDDDDETLAVLTPDKYDIIPFATIEITYEDIILNSAEYEGNFGNLAVTLYNINEKLVFITPNIPQGEQILEIYINNLTYELLFNVQPATQIPNPEEYISSFIVTQQEIVNTNSNLINLLVPENEIDLYTNELEHINQIFTDASELLQSASNTEKLEAAMFISANKVELELLQSAVNNYAQAINGLINNGKLGVYDSESAFRNAYSAFVLARIQLISHARKIIVWTAAGAIAGSWFPIIGTGIGAAIGAGIGIGSFLLAVEADNMATNQLLDFESIVDELNTDLNKSDFTFINNQYRPFNISGSYHSLNIEHSSSSMSNIQQFISYLSVFAGLFDKINSKLPEIIQIKPKVINDVTTYNNRTRQIHSNYISIGNISNSNVSISTQSIDGDLKLSFSTTEVEDQEFSFDINYNYDGFSSTVLTKTATLKADIELSIVDKLVQWGPWKSEVFQVEDGGYQYIIFTWAGSECYCLQGSWYWTSGILDTSVTLCFAEYTDEYTYTVSDNDGNDPCPPENQANADILKIVEITEDILKLDVDEGEIMIFTPIGN